MTFLRSTLFAVALASPSWAQTTARVHVPSDDPATLRSQLEHAGFDVTAAEGGVLVFGGKRDFERLDARGLKFSRPTYGRPLRDVLAERNPARGVPSGYQDLASIEATLQQTATDHPAICRFVDLSVELGVPPTFEGRTLKAVKISGDVSADQDEPAVLIVSLHHAREIVTPVITLDAIERLTDGYGNVPAITAAVDGHEIWIVPVVNPDGYEHVFNVDDNWRKNRRVVGNDVGVDLNRNYSHGWTSGCSGSSNPGSNTYKGTHALSEPEARAIVALAESRRFEKVLDFHSRGRETLWGYACDAHPFDALYEAQAIALSTAAGYGNDARPPSADGEHQHWHSGRQGAFAFLIETAVAFQPPYADATAESAQVQGAIDWMLQHEVSLSGHVTSACGGLPLDAAITLLGPSLTPGEVNRSGGRFGRWHLNAPPGTYDLEFSAPGYQTEQVQVTVQAGSPTVLDVQLTGPAQEAYCPATANSTGAVGQLALVGSNGLAANDVDLLASALPVGESCLFIAGQVETVHPLFEGTLCVSNPLVRLGVAISDGAGTATFSVDVAQPLSPIAQITAGSTWRFQAVYRDLAAGGTRANLTRALRVPFCP